MEISFAGKSAVVTGASNGIGKGIALALAQAGAAVTIVGRSPEALTASGNEIRAAAPGARVEAFPGDVADPLAATACMAAAVRHFGSVDILVNNAPPGGQGRLMEIPIEQMDLAAAAGPRAVVLWTRAAWDAWMRDHGGAVVNIGSVAADVVERRISYYSAVKSAVLTLTQHLAAELGPNVRVNAASPGWILNRGEETGFAPHRDKLAPMLPLQRLGEPEDMARVVVFLASDLARYVTGQNVQVDGGRMSAYSLFTMGTGRT
jgi:NAD(P)-dependent dehydrogenase (short-subunit alcohol dehydrogenase family)